MKNSLNIGTIAFIIFGLVSLPDQANAKNKNIASWYKCGKKRTICKTANGDKFNSNKLTAAHKTLPFGTKVKVTNIKNNKSVIVTINDRGPFTKGRIIDLTKSAANIIGIKGIEPVSIKVIS